MKYYSIDSNARKTAIIVLLIISSFAVKFINKLIREYLTNIPVNLSAFISELDFWGISITSLTLLGFFGILYAIYSRWLWKVPLIKNLHNVPNLSGLWKGELTSTFKTNGKPTRVKVSIEIIQDWDHMRIKCYFPKSSSYNNGAFLSFNGSNGVDLGFPYCNDAHCLDWKTKKHDGYNFLNISGSTMTGQYFTNREDGTSGIMELKRIDKIKSRRKH